ncbi:MAG: DUF1624 domain-containing protein [Candidatus Kapaibacterium sp.]|nr:MAG: DUF1624 domain-containing protein [Candidatus Kapabacteria bacterium]
MSTLASSLGANAHPTKQRFYILDFVRLIAMIMMMQGHTMDAMVSVEYLNVAEFPWNIWHFLRGLTAPTFLIISGAVQIFATKRDATGRVPFKTIQKRVQWGLMLIGMAYLLVFPANRLLDLPFVSHEGWRAFFQTNILHVSGVTLIFSVLLMSVTRSNRAFAGASVCVGLLILAFAPIADSIDWFAVVPEWLGAYFTFKHGSLFAIFPFSAYMFLGIGIGYALAEMPARERERRFPPFAFVAGSIALLAGVIGTYSPLTLFPAHDYYLASPCFALIRVGCVLVFMGILTYLYAKTRRFEEYYSRLGKKSLYIYTSHLILLFGTPWFGGIARAHYRSMTLMDGCIVALGVVGCTLLSAYILDYFQRNSRSLREGIRISLAAMLLYALLV